VVIITLPTDVSSLPANDSLKSPSAKTDFVSLFSLIPSTELPPPPIEPPPMLSILSFIDPIDPRERIDLLVEIPFSMEDTDLFSASSPGTDSG